MNLKEALRAAAEHGEVLTSGKAQDMHVLDASFTRLVIQEWEGAWRWEVHVLEDGKWFLLYKMDSNDADLVVSVIAQTFKVNRRIIAQAADIA